MSVYFFREMDHVKSDILGLCALAEERLHDAVQAVINQDRELAESVIERDSEIDAREVEIEEELLKIMALHQPVAVDLRFLVATLRINNDLERVGDLAANIAQRALVLCRKAQDRVPVDLAEMSQAVEALLHRSIDALVNMDAQAAADVCRDDDTIDDMKDEINRTIKLRMVEATDKKSIDVLVALLRVTRDLERVADHATNIAEDLMYITQGQIVRHHVAELAAEQREEE